MNFELMKQIRDQEGRRESFFRLAREVFGLSFREWYEGGFWTEKYIPYALCLGDQVEANVSVNQMKFEFHGKTRNYVQLGTVMTDPKYRGQGLSRRLMEEIRKDWEGRCDGMYLFANSDVLDFYPRFGFEKSMEYEWRMVPKEDSEISAHPEEKAGQSPFRPMSLKNREDMERFCRCLDRGNPFSALQMRDNLELVMFYCGGELKDSVFYWEAYDMVCVGEREGDTFFCLELLGGEGISLAEAAEAAVPAGIKTVVFGFSPRKEDRKDLEKRWKLECVPLTSDVTLFVRGNAVWPAEHRLRFPELSHT